MSIDLTDINVQEKSSFIKDEQSQIDYFAAARAHEVNFTYSGGATAGNYQTSVNVTQMGKVKSGGQFTGTVIVTLHDIGLNHFSNYATLFQNKGMEPLLQNFTVFHVDYPCMQTNYNGSSNGNRQWDRNLIYPSFDELANSMIPTILEYFHLRSVIFIGTGVGSNIATRFALKNPDYCVGLISFNPVHYAIGWKEWFDYKTYSVSNDKLREQLMDYLFSSGELGGCSGDLIASTQQNLQQMDQEALLAFYNAFKTRTEIDIERPLLPTDLNKPNVLKINSMIIIGDWASNFMEDAMELNSRLNPEKSNFVKLSDAGGMVYEEQPTKCAESIKLFLQGLGYLATILPTKLAEANSRKNEKLAAGDGKNSKKSEQNSFEGRVQQTTSFNTRTVHDLI